MCAYKNCVKRSRHAKISTMSKASIAFMRPNAKQEIVWKFAGAPIMRLTHCFFVLYIGLWMWALQVPPGLTAVGWILLQHQYLQCWQLIAAPACLKLPQPCWTLNSLLSPFSTWTFTLMLHWSAVWWGTIWLCEWAILLFWEGLEYKSFVLKNENRDGCYFYSVTKRHGLRMVLFPWCRHAHVELSTVK